MTRDPGELVGETALGDALARLRGVVMPRAEVRGWATVELDRAQAELVARPDERVAEQVAEGVAEPADDDSILGARCRLLCAADGRTVVLIEASTEGLLAAALARYGEGILALYFLVGPDAPARAREAGFSLTSERPGPFGPQHLVMTEPRFGPFLLLAGLD